MSVFSSVGVRQTWKLASLTPIVRASVRHIFSMLHICRFFLPRFFPHELIILYGTTKSTIDNLCVPAQVLGVPEKLLVFPNPVGDNQSIATNPLSSASHFKLLLARSRSREVANYGEIAVFLSPCRWHFSLWKKLRGDLKDLYLPRTVVLSIFVHTWVWILKYIYYSNVIHCKICIKDLKMEVALFFILFFLKWREGNGNEYDDIGF